MRVYETAEPIKAYVFELVDGNVRFDELESDVRADGGYVERKADDLVVVNVGGNVWTLPLGFAVVVESGVGRIIKAAEFRKRYVGADEVDGDIDYKLSEAVAKLADRVAELEAKLASKPKGTSKAKTAGAGGE